jgi:Tol biopolymer transport system component
MISQHTTLAAVALGTFAMAFGVQPQAPQPPAAPGGGIERHLANITQLTSGGENAEAYFSPDGKRLIYQSNPGGASPTVCDQMMTMNVDGSNKVHVSRGGGRTTCGYFYPDGQSILYASTRLGGPDCPPRPSFERGYVWPIYGTYDIFRAAPDGTNIRQLTKAPGYDAEATVAPDGRVVFTSVRDGDMEIYSMNGDGTDVRRLTTRPGPDGGPWFSPDGKQIVFRGRAISDAKELADYQSLLKQELWRPTTLEIFVMNRDGSNLRQVTKLGGANFAPAWHANGRRIIFSSNSRDPKGRNFDIFSVNLDGSGLEQITYNDTFDGFPMFSPDGKKLVFGSNRSAKAEGETNVFIADWVE